MRMRYVGLAEESEFNVSPAPAAELHVDIASATLDVPSDTEIIYSGGLQRSARTHRPGFYSVSGNFAYAFDIDTIGMLLKWALNGYVFTSGGGTIGNLHEFFGNNEVILDSFCTRVGKDLFEHVFHGCAVNSLELSIDGEFCVATVDVVGAKDSKATLKAIGDLSLPTPYPLAFHEATVSIDGSDVSCEVKSFTLSINNGQDAGRGQGLGSRNPCRMVAGEREVTVEMDLFFDSTEEIERIWGSADGPSDSGSTEFALGLSLDSGDYGTMEIELPVMIYTSVTQQPTGRDEIVQSTAARAFIGTVTLDDASTEESEVLVTLDNTEGVYGAYPGTISGTVTDDSGGAALENVTVTASDGSTTTTGVDGTYTLTGVESGTLDITFELDSYTTGTLEDVVLEPNEDLTGQDIALVAV